MSKYDDLPRIAHVIDEFNVVINKGSESGVELGQTFLIFGLGPTLTDPSTNESLGELEIVKGRAKVQHLQASMCTLRSVEHHQRDSGRKIIKRSSGFSLAFGNEEIIENPSTEIKRLDDPEIGDYARKI